MVHGSRGWVDSQGFCNGVTESQAGGHIFVTEK